VVERTETKVGRAGGVEMNKRSWEGLGTNEARRVKGSIRGGLSNTDCASSCESCCKPGRAKLETFQRFKVN